MSNYIENPFLLFLTALIPIFTSFIYYSPNLFGKHVWEVLDDEDGGKKIAKPNMIVYYGSTYLLSVIISFALIPIVVHQVHIFSILINEIKNLGADNSLQLYQDDFILKYGRLFRTFKHGAIHGFIFSVFVVTPITIINGIIQLTPIKNSLIKAGYWIINFTLMGAVICEYI